ncbi:hypothetical protein CQW23_11742 [Capsicum baccatum]|uniref:Fe2OG dioxygenase domain-containing protein n=1 Tax=Capsicum baccatum TaxID=33114 RepID=A0A2G2WQL7_CAPBA|nr:hypothetical protein CQW23_11742 [Capsicum baccatum]
MNNSAIPIVDLSPFLLGDEDGKRKEREVINEACSRYGFFQIVNHGVPLDLMSRALKLSKSFFECPVEEKIKCSPLPGAPFPAGYNRKPNPSYEFSEYLVMLQPGSTFNVFPAKHPQLRQVMGDLFNGFSKTGAILESILNESLGLPPSTLEEFNNDRNSDVLTALHYLPATETGKIGVNSHKDVGCITFVLQDEVGGLEVQNDGKWIPVTPKEGALVVNMGIVLQHVFWVCGVGDEHTVNELSGCSALETMELYFVDDFCSVDVRSLKLKRLKLDRYSLLDD